MSFQKTELNFDQYIKDKTIALVGNSESLFFNDNTGCEIDDHDIVIRINRPAIFYDDRDSDQSHGRRMDVWAFWDHGFFVAKVDPSKNPPMLNRALEMKNFNVLDMRQQMTRRSFKFNDHFIGVDRYDLLDKYTTPGAVTYRNFSTGMYIIAMINEFSFKELNLYGFDWKRSPTFNEADTHLQNIIHGSRRFDIRCCHEYQNEEEIAFKYFLSQDRINLKGQFWLHDS